MALEGSIKDFGLADIFQLISLQKKTGMLNIHNKEITATVTFDKGQISYAAVEDKKGEIEKIGRLLIGAGKLKEKEIDEAIQIQGKTGERIGKILIDSGCISREDLKEYLSIQIKDVIFLMLRWRDGWYRFDSQEIEHNKEEQILIPTDFILMECTRMLDEWPYIESIIPSDDIIFSQSFEGEDAGALFSSLSPGELTIFNLINGERDVKKIIDHIQLGEFDVYKILATLKMSGLITPKSISSRVEDVPVSEGYEKKHLLTILQFAILTFILSFILLLLPIKEMVGINDIMSILEIMKVRDSRNELFHIHKAINYYRISNGMLPDSLELLQKEGYMKRGHLIDHLGSLFVYEKISPILDYRLYSKGVDKKLGTKDDIY